MIKYLAIVIFICASLQSRAQVNIITTIAGTDSAGFNGDNGPAINAVFNRPCAMCLDKLGNIYIADGFNHRVRKITLATGLITTIAGNGTGGFSGDNVLAINSELFVPEGVVIDNDGNTFIADGLNNRIRKVAISTGIITTIAGTGAAGGGGDGGQAIYAELNQPVGLHIHNEYLYISDYNNNKIRKVNLLTGTISTVAGNGGFGYSGDNDLAKNAQLYGPVDVFIDSTGNVFIADQWNSAIRRVDALTNIITTFAGIGIQGYSGDGGQAIECKLNEPVGVFVDKQGNVFIADYRNGAIRKIDAITGKIFTVVGGIPGYGGDGGPATNAKLKCTDVWVDDGGAIYIADYVNQRIRKVNNALKVNSGGLTNKEELLLYPNPTTGRFMVQAANGVAIITIRNMAGDKVYTAATFTEKTEVNLTLQPPGIYLVYVRCGEDEYVSKIVLVK